MITVGKLAKRFGLSRSTLLYYERLGLLSPSARSASGYRIYNKEDGIRLRKIKTYRNAGLSLEAIGNLLDQAGAQNAGLLRLRLAELDQQISQLRQQQISIGQLISGLGDVEPVKIMNKADWIKLLRRAGMSEGDMHQWHVEFEASSPEAHHSFLGWLGIPEQEIALIRVAINSE